MAGLVRGGSQCRPAVHFFDFVFTLITSLLFEPAFSRLLRAADSSLHILLVRTDWFAEDGSR